MLCKVTHCIECILSNTRPHQLRLGYSKMGVAISCTICSQVALASFVRQAEAP